MKEYAIILDLDNTLVYSTIKGTIPENNTREEWDEFLKNNEYYNVKYMEPIFETIELLEKFYKGFLYYKPKFIFLTAREDTANGLVRLNTYRFIKNNFSMFDTPHCYNRDYLLLMRKENDFRTNTEVKEDYLKNYILPNYEPLFAFEDEEENVKMFSRNGVVTLKVYNKE